MNKEKLAKRLIPSPALRWINYNLRLKVPRQNRIYASVVKRVQSSGRCKVAFIVSSMPMWRYQGLLELMMRDSRFDVHVIVAPFCTFSPEERAKCTDEITRHFSPMGVQLVAADDYADFKRTYRPDLLFYPQPYRGVYDKTALEWTNNRDTLLAISPYCIPITKSAEFVNQKLFCLAWRYFVPTPLHRQLAVELSDNRGENTLVSGELLAPSLLSPPLSDPWKECGDGLRRKRVIWAPHFSINNDPLFPRPDFNWSHTVMRALAVELRDKVQFAFKPHPRLLSELYRHPDWGREKADEFYAFWAESDNTQLVTGPYLDLFKTSDAMVHNCGSFTAEYMWMDKPAGYVTTGINNICADLNAFGRQCQDAHTTLSTPDSIRQFIEQTVIEGNDPKAGERHRLFDTVLTAGRTASAEQVIYNHLIEAFGWTY